MNAPLIGITGRRLPGTRLAALEPRYQVRDFDMYFSDYSRCLAQAGAIPVSIPYDCRPLALIDRLDGLLVTGGQDMSPDAWGGRPGDAEGDIDPTRDRYELALVAAAQRRGIPVLGICRGMQLLNVAHGGSLVADLEVGRVDHRGGLDPVEQLTHSVETTPGSLAATVYGPRVRVNSLHHQAVDRPGRGIAVTGRAEDGVPEIIELPDRPVLGVQWHPEWMPHDDPAFAWLIDRAGAPLAAAAQAARS